MKIIVGVIAHESDGFSEMVKAAQETCYKNPPQEFEVFYIYGASEAFDDWQKVEIHGNHFRCHTPENRKNILRKTVAFFEYCLNNKSFDYILRPNIGSYIDLPIYKKYLIDNDFTSPPKNKIYFGPKALFKKGEHQWWYASGSGYLISKDIVKAIVKNASKLEYKGIIDDCAIGKFITQDLNINVRGGATRKGTRHEEITNSLVDEKSYHYHFDHRNEEAGIRKDCFYKLHELIESR